MKQGDIITQGQSVILPTQYIGSFSRDMASGAGTTVITSLGFAPSSVSLTLGSTTSLANIASWGLDNGSQRYAIYNSGQSVTDTYAMINVFSIYVRTSTEIYTGTCVMDTDGFTVTWAQSGASVGNLRIVYSAFK
jgi:hypothetical protein